ncbi:hypothetical protein NPIL_282671, partial [Nephila pilipes]
MFRKALDETLSYKVIEIILLQLRELYGTLYGWPTSIIIHNTPDHNGNKSVAGSLKESLLSFQIQWMTMEVGEQEAVWFIFEFVNHYFAELSEL